MIWYAPSCKCHEAHLPMPFMQIPSNASHLLQRRQSLGHAFSLKPGGERAHGQVSEQRMVLLMAMQVGCILETAQQYDYMNTSLALTGQENTDPCSQGSPVNPPGRPTCRQCSD